jgi:hypothetical protein
VTDQIVTETIDFIQRRELSAVKQALQAVTALHDALALKREIRLPVLAETRDAILELEDQILALKLESLHALSHPDQPRVPPGARRAVLVSRPDILRHLLRGQGSIIKTS